MDNEENVNAAPAPEAVPPTEEKCDCCCTETPAPAEEKCDCACSCEDAPASAAEESAPAEEPAGDVPGKAEKTERPVIPVTPEMLEDVRGKLAMMLDYLGEREAAAAIEKAIATATGSRMKSMAAGKMGYSTSEVGDLIVSLL